LIGSRGRVQQDVALDIDLLDQVKLALDEINVIFLTLQDVPQQSPAIRSHRRFRTLRSSLVARLKP
jgi:hypothetical protein